jgi:mRNA-degrading endonuclease RelE of RelBE toxin-antitoxin system
MKTRVLVGARVRVFLESLAPEPRRKFWSGIKGLAQNRGDIKQLEGKLAPFWRLKVGRMRVVFGQRSVRGERQLLCFFADYRATIYSVLEQLLASGLIEELSDSLSEDQN